MPARFDDATTDTRRGVPRDLGGHPDGFQIQDDICITGFSGRLPESSSIEEFKRNLMEGVDMVNDDDRRWPKGLYELPTRIGKIKDEDLQNLDAEFFKIHQKQAECMDPQMRMLLECTHEAIIVVFLRISRVNRLTTASSKVVAKSTEKCVILRAKDQQRQLKQKQVITECTEV